ncbi:hypothetical protein DICPUDRAFT_36954, partial [Dictyostelium purpureum]
CKNGHISCRECWIRQLSIKKECPTCKVKTDMDSLSRNIFLENSFRKNLVYCPYLFKESKFNNELIKDDSGCRAKITIEEFENHINICQYKFCNCPNNETKCKTITRKNLTTAHNEVCEYVIVSCDGCEEPIEKCELRKHKETSCSATKDKCTVCFEDVGRTLLKQHIDHECKKILIDCLYKNGGCTDRFERGLINEHLSKYNNHIFFIQNMINKETKFEEISKEFKNILDINAQLEKRIKHLETTISLNRDSSSVNLQKYIGKWTINNWDQKVATYTAGRSFNSPYFFIGSFQFFLMIYPNGNADARNHVSIFLYKILDKPTTVKYCLEAKNADPTKNYKNSHINHFSTNNGNGWFRFIDNKVNNGFFTNNQLVINIKVKTLPTQENIETN